VKLIIEPADGVEPLLTAIKSAKNSVEIAVFRFDRTDIETALKAAAKRGVKVGTFLKRAKTQLLIYDPKISDKEMLRILQERAKAGVEIKVIGSVAGRAQLDVQKLAGNRLHTRTIIRDRRQAFVGSQSLRTAELDSRRELGLIVQDARAVKTLIETFESDWACTNAKKAQAPPKEPEAPIDAPTAVSIKEAEKAVQILTKELDPLAVSVKKAVRKAVAKAGEDVLQDKDVKDTMKKVVKKAVKEAVKEAVQDAVVSHPLAERP
jgi:phosphatidylserine/phosphatidylglycerophosphate/cardiolipin synthase-like enzyme